MFKITINQALLDSNYQEGFGKLDTPDPKIMFRIGKKYIHEKGKKLDPSEWC